MRNDGASETLALQSSLPPDAALQIPS